MGHIHLIFTVTYLLITTISSNAMDPTNKFDLDSIQEITAVEKPRCVCYVTDKKLAILSESAHSIILDLQTKKSECITKARNGYRLDFPLLEKNNKKIIMAHDTNVVIYNRDTNIKQLISGISAQKIRLDIAHPKIYSFIEHPKNDALFLCYQKKAIVKYDCVSHTREEIPVVEHNCYIMAKHPQKEIICVAEYSGKISLRELDNITKPLNIIKLPDKCCCFCKYSPNGSYIVAGNQRALYIIDFYKNNIIYPFITFSGSKIIDCIAFHPNGLLAILLVSPRSSLIEYWNLKTQQIICETQLKYFDQGSDLCFSDDGLEIVIAFNDKCVRMLVPFAVKEKCSFLLFILNQLKEKNNVSNDIVRHSMYILLKHLCF